MAISAKYLFRSWDLTTDSSGNSHTLTNWWTPTFSASSPTWRSILYNWSNNYSTVPIYFTKTLVSTISFWLKQIWTTANQSYLWARRTSGWDSDRTIQYDTNWNNLNLYTRYDAWWDASNWYIRQLFPYNDWKWHYVTINETSTGRNALVDWKYPLFWPEYADARSFGNLQTRLLWARINNGSVERYANCQMADFEIHNANISAWQHKTKYAYYLGML
jgi:hypothetical protein